MSTPRPCAGCGRPLPSTARPDRLHHNSTCRAQARRRRLHDEREAVQRASARKLGLSPEFEAALARALSEERLVAFIARARVTNWRARTLGIGNVAIPKSGVRRRGPTRPSPTAARRTA